MVLRWRSAGAKGPFAPSSQTDQGSIGSEVKAGRKCVPSPPPSTLDGPGDLTSAPVSILRAERRPTNTTTTSQLPRHSGFLGQDLTMGQGLGSTGSLPVPTKLSYCIKRMEPQHLGWGWRAGRDRDMAIGTAIPHHHFLECRRRPFHSRVHRDTSSVFPALADEKVSLCPQCGEEGQGDLSDSKWGGYLESLPASAGPTLRTLTFGVALICG